MSGIIGGYIYLVVYLLPYICVSGSAMRSPTGGAGSASRVPILKIGTTARLAAPPFPSKQLCCLLGPHGKRRGGNGIIGKCIYVIVYLLPYICVSGSAMRSPTSSRARHRVFRFEKSERRLASPLLLLPANSFVVCGGPGERRGEGERNYR